MPLVALVVMVVVARALKTHLEVLQLQILVVVAEAEAALAQTLAEMVAQVLSSFVMLAHSVVQAEQLRLVAVTPSTPSHHPAHTPHKEQTWL
jgi:hypothetical protein